jgi:glycosyltransferase involved in cell wall biosynthesis
VCKITDSNYRLQICGVGDSEEEIKKAVSRDSRIEFLGRLSREEVLRLQKNATVLVNPRQNNEEFTKYSFPSKNLEYLSSGIPMIAYKLDGIPNDYDRYICYVEDNSVEALSKKIIDVCELTQAQRHLYGYEARKYVMEHKNEIVQTKKIIQMLSE